MVKRSDNDSAFKKFLDENKSLKFMLPILIVLVVALIIINFVTGRNKKTVSKDADDNNAPIAANQHQVEVLPKIIRTDDESKQDVNRDPFSEPMKLVGVIHSESRSAAIIEWGNYSYIVRNGETVGESNWKVIEIKKDKLTLESAAGIFVLSLDE